MIGAENPVVATAEAVELPSIPLRVGISSYDLSGGGNVNNHVQLVTGGDFSCRFY